MMAYHAHINKKTQSNKKYIKAPWNADFGGICEGGLYHRSNLNGFCFDTPPIICSLVIAKLFFLIQKKKWQWICCVMVHHLNLLLCWRCDSGKWMTQAKSCPCKSQGQKRKKNLLCCWNFIWTSVLWHLNEACASLILRQCAIGQNCSGPRSNFYERDVLLLGLIMAGNTLNVVIIFVEDIEDEIPTYKSKHLSVTSSVFFFITFYTLYKFKKSRVNFNKNGSAFLKPSSPTV